MSATQETTTLTATHRTTAGKGSARSARRAGLIPAVIYGDKKAPDNITLNANSFRKLVSQPGIFRQILAIDLGGKKTDVLPREIQFHPITDTPLHVDFLRVSKGAIVTVMVAMRFINEDLAPGLKKGGILNVVRYEVEVSCPASAIPEEFVVDLTGYEVGDSIHISAVTMPEGVAPTITDRDFTVATLTAPMEEKATSTADADAEEADSTEAETSTE